MQYISCLLSEFVGIISFCILVSYIVNMAIASSSHLYLSFFCMLMLVLIPPLSSAADSDPLQDFCVADLNATVSVNGFPCKPATSVISEDFFFDGLSKEGSTNVFGSKVTAGSVLQFPGVNTLAVSMNRVDFAAGGLNPPHSHPHATEIGVVIKGQLLVGFVTTDNKFHSKVLNPGQVFVIPRGLVHFQKNVGWGKALAFTAFNSQLPGVVLVAPTLFGSQPPIPNDVLTKTLQVGDDVINNLRTKFTS